MPEFNLAASADGKAFCTGTECDARSRRHYHVHKRKKKCITEGDYILRSSRLHKIWIFNVTLYAVQTSIFYCCQNIVFDFIKHKSSFYSNCLQLHPLYHENISNAKRAILSVSIYIFLKMCPLLPKQTWSLTKRRTDISSKFYGAK